MNKNNEDGKQKSFCERPLHLVRKIQKAKKKKPNLMMVNLSG
jgi:hypothetical protein